MKRKYFMVQRIIIDDLPDRVSMVHTKWMRQEVVSYYRFGWKGTKVHCN